ncbi:MAG: hypothetical protein WAK48_28970 [Candidatus Acidiferrum sp.]|jgi:hypothetical protein
MSTDLNLQELDAHHCLNGGEAPDAESGAPALAEASGWRKVTDVLNKHYTNPDIEAARILCAVIASHAVKEFPPVWNLAIAPPGSMKTVLLEGFRGLPRVCFVDEITPKTFLSGKVDERGQKRKSPASLLHRIGPDGILIAADFSTYTADPKTLKVILAQLRRIYDGNYCREFGTDEHLEERNWEGRLTFLAGAVPDVDRHYSLFQSLGERFIRTRWPRAGGVKAALQAMEHTDAIGAELRDSVHSLLLPILSDPQMAPSIPAEIKHQIANLGEFMALSRSYIERDRNTREAVGVPVAEGNTRLPKQLCQLARGLALLEGHSEVREEDYKLVCRAAFDSLPLARIAALKAILEGKSPFTIGQPKATVSRALEDLELSGVLVKSRVACQAADTDCPRALSETARELVTGAGLLKPEPTGALKP